MAWARSRSVLLLAVLGFGTLDRSLRARRVRMDPDLALADAAARPICVTALTLRSGEGEARSWWLVGRRRRSEASLSTTSALVDRFAEALQAPGRTSAR